MDSELKYFKLAIQQNGYSIEDFELLEEDLTNWGTGQIINIPKKGQVHVMYKPTNKIKIYNTGHGTHGLDEFIKDLSLNFFK